MLIIQFVNEYTVSGELQYPIFSVCTFLSHPEYPGVTLRIKCMKETEECEKEEEEEVKGDGEEKGREGEEQQQLSPELRHFAHI